MAVNPAGTIFKSLTFDGKTSREYGVHITGEAVFNAPERDVEMISIPGRNGAFALDHGHFNNIEVTYPAGVFAEDERDFADAVSDFRNWLCSRSGYCRLTDDYNPNEYRLAVYKSGLEVSPALLRAGEFDIVFDCKPQRYLTSGETKLTVTNNSTVTNPTLFDARPQLQVYGYGTVNINNVPMVVTGQYIGNVVVYSGTPYYTITFDDQYANSGDAITVGIAECNCYWECDSLVDAYESTTTTSGSGTASVRQNSPGGVILTLQENSENTWGFVYGTSATKSVTGTYNLYRTISADYWTGTVVLSVAYDGVKTFTASVSETLPTHFTRNSSDRNIGSVTLNSTQNTLGNPIYIDLDIGEAYKVENGSAVSVNNAVTIPAELPTLKPGNNTISFSNTFTKVDIVPRWWKV